MTIARRLRIMFLTARLCGGSAWFHIGTDGIIATGWAPLRQAE